MHGDPIQRVTLGCNNPDCEAKPMVTGGDRYANGETGEFFKKGELAAREKAIKYWNKCDTRADLCTPATSKNASAERVREALSYIKLFCGVHVRNERDRNALDDRFKILYEAAQTNACEVEEVTFDQVVALLTKFIMGAPTVVSLIREHYPDGIRIISEDKK